MKLLSFGLLFSHVWPIICIALLISLPYFFFKGGQLLHYGVKALKRYLTAAVVITGLVMSSCEKQELRKTPPDAPPPPPQSVPLSSLPYFKTKTEAIAWIKRSIARREHTGIIQPTALKTTPKPPNDNPDVEFIWEPDGSLIIIVHVGGSAAFGTYGFKVSFGVFANNSQVNGGGQYAAGNFTSGLTGLTLGLNWRQQQTNYFNYPNSFLIHFEINGDLTTGVNINGYGFYYTSYMVLEGWYNIKTGQYSFSHYERIIN